MGHWGLMGGQGRGMGGVWSGGQERHGWREGGCGVGERESREEWGRGGPLLWGRGHGVRGMQEKARVQAQEDWDLVDVPVVVLGLFRLMCGVRAGLGLPLACLFCLCRAALGFAKNPSCVIKPRDFSMLSSPVHSVSIPSEIQAATCVW